jgi:hypothetical protein
MGLSKKEERILELINRDFVKDPKKPEFPPEHPRFPATPIYHINVPNFSNVWLKDESVNPTGTHKDRMAWELVLAYRDMLLAKKHGIVKRTLPKMSIISSGSAANAIQTRFRKYEVPRLRVLVDIHIYSYILEGLKKSGCLVYKTDLSKKSLGWKEILQLTHNLDGLDITSNEALDPTNKFYDWLSYEILNENPEYVFIPFGTGHLYANILNVSKKEISSHTHPDGFKGDIRILRKCNFIGATTNNPRSKADKLYSHHSPFMHFNEQWRRYYQCCGFCGEKTDVLVIHEKFLDKAIELAEKQGITCEPSGIAGLALLMQIEKQIPKNKKIIIVNTGKTKYLG